MQIDLLGISTARPPGILTQEQAMELNVTRAAVTPRHEKLLRRLYRLSSVRERASVLADESLEEIRAYYPPADGENGHGPTVSERMARYARDAPPLGARASRGALEAARTAPGDIAHVVTVSCTGFTAPGLDSALIRELGLPPTVGRSAIGFMGCHGAINGLRVASALAGASPGQGVLLCAVELCSLHFHYGWEDGKAVANTLFADGAAAAVLRARDDDAISAGDAWRVRATGSCLLPDSLDDMGWQIGDHGFEMSLSSRVPSIIGANLADWIDRWLGEHGLRRDDVRSWAIHPGGPRVIDSVRDTLGLDDGQTTTSREVLAECGNMSSPTVLFILQRMARQRAPRPCVTLAFGPGLVAEAALLD